jgi:FG-GAP-like repeat/ASPIC and UnbV/Secretion system C-terminal sorting domain
MKVFNYILTITIYIIISVSVPESLNAQVFTKITDQNNPVVTDTWSGQYVGASWIDFDNDGFLDLYICGKPLYRNTGDGNFEKIVTALSSEGGVQGNSWADYDNDGNIDCFLVATTSNTLSYLFRNNGNNTFTKITTGDIGNATYNSGWGCSWADYNNDGFVDLIIAAANNAGVVNHPSRFFKNNSDGTFTKIDTTLFTTQVAPYTIPTWSDYDQDGDIDLFIGSGPANSTFASDYLFDNLLQDTGVPNLVRIDTSIIGTDLVDGQVWNWVDYDNDGDLDAYLTNYWSTIPNNLYRNEGNQYFIKATEQQVGTIVSDLGNGLANVWGDFDNDGDLDCIVTNDNVTDKYYRNNNDGTFTSVVSIETTLGSGPQYGITVGDYNNDGFLDLYIPGTNTTKGLYRNDSQNGNSWINIKCVGIGEASGSNYSAIGTKVKAKATINGNSVWQMREVSSQNSFNAMNMLNVHFGFGDATTIDSIVIEWSRGIKDIYTKVVVNNFYTAVEGQSFVTGVKDYIPAVKSFKLEQNYPNPFNPSTVISYRLSVNGFVSLKVYDVLGNQIATLVNENKPAGSYEVNFNAVDFLSGIYFYQLKTNNYYETKKMILMK